MAFPPLYKFVDYGFLARFIFCLHGGAVFQTMQKRQPIARTAALESSI
jgi:hypothetical protein